MIAIVIVYIYARLNPSFDLVKTIDERGKKSVSIIIWYSKRKYREYIRLHLS
jgi:hypothetical protein